MAMIKSYSRVCRVCTKCGELFIDWTKQKTFCEDCANLSLPTAQSHPVLARCPHCGKTTHIPDLCSMAGGYEELREGEHEIMCEHCEGEFEFETRIKYSFVSPPTAISKYPDNEEDKEDEEDEEETEEEETEDE